MNEQTINMINDLAEKLGTTAERLLELYTAQASVAFLHSMIIFIVLGALSVGLLCVAYKCVIYEGPYEDFATTISVGAGAFGICAVFALILNICTIPWLTAWLHPEFWAMERLIIDLGKFAG